MREEAADEGSSVVVLGGAATGDLHTQEEYATEMAARIVAAIKPLGFRYVSLDLEGYRTGSLNEVLQIARDPIR